MSKILTVAELDCIISNNLLQPEIDDQGQYEQFVLDLARVVTKHFGGKVGSVHKPGPDTHLYSVGILLDRHVPSDGGVYKRYDRDVTWKGGVEE